MFFFLLIKRVNYYLHLPTSFEIPSEKEMRHCTTRIFLDVDWISGHKTMAWFKVGTYLSVTVSALIKLLLTIPSYNDRRVQLLFCTAQKRTKSFSRYCLFPKSGKWHMSRSCCAQKQRFNSLPRRTKLSLNAMILCGQNYN